MTHTFQNSGQNHAEKKNTVAIVCEVENIRFLIKDAFLFMSFFVLFLDTNKLCGDQMH